MKGWLSNNFDEKKILTFTIRNSPYQKYRNSNLENWTRLNSALNKNYNILVLPDYENEYNENYIISKFKGAKVLPKFLGINLSNRLAVYKNSFYNLGVSSGSMGLCYLSDCYFIQFKTINDKFESTSRQQLLKLGMFSKNNFFFLGKNQKIIQNFNEETEYMLKIVNQTI